MTKIYVLAENTAADDRFSCEHGLSLFIETAGLGLLFDSGQTALFASNAKLLGADLGKAEFAVLSHGHYDHGGGLEKFLEINGSAPVYMNRRAFGKFYNGTEKYIGLPEKLKESGRIVFTGDHYEICPGFELCTCNDRKPVFPSDSAGLNVKTGDSFESDHFLHEQYLSFYDGGRKIVISGCSHKGVLNIMNWLRPDIFVGGFHFMKQDISGQNEVLDNAAEILSGFPCVYYTCHCTGRGQYEYLKERMGGKLRYISSGDVITL